MTVLSLMDLTVSLFKAKINHFKMNIHDRTESARNTIVENALGHNCSHVLFVDEDATFPADACEQLLKRDKDIIGVNAMGKMSHTPVIKEDAEGKPLDYIKGGIVHVNAIGMHFTLIKIGVFEKVRKPWFYAKPIEGYARVNSEDYTFCKDARHGYGINTYCDLDLSIQCGHVRYRTDVSYMDSVVREQMAKQEGK
jgi:hypothetical protein